MLYFKCRATNSFPIPFSKSCPFFSVCTRAYWIRSNKIDEGADRFIDCTTFCWTECCFVRTLSMSGIDARRAVADGMHRGRLAWLVLPARLHERLHRWQLSSNLARLLTSGLWRIWASIKCVRCANYAFNLRLSIARANAWCIVVALLALRFVACVHHCVACLRHQPVVALIRVFRCPGNTRRRV